MVIIVDLLWYMSKTANKYIKTCTVQHVVGTGALSDSLFVLLYLLQVFCVYFSHFGRSLWSSLRHILQSMCSSKGVNVSLALRQSIVTHKVIVWTSIIKNFFIITCCFCHISHDLYTDNNLSILREWILMMYIFICMNFKRSDERIYVKKTEHFTLCVKDNGNTKTAIIKMVVLQSWHIFNRTRTIAMFYL